MADKSGRIVLSKDRKKALIAAIRAYFDEQLDQDIGDLKAALLLDFFVAELGATVYNQAIRDAHSYVADKLIDLEGELYEPERRGKRAPS